MPHARISDPETSVEAAKSVQHVTSTQSAIRSLLVNAMTDEELFVAYTKAVSQGSAPLASPSGVRSRRAELVVLGLVEDTGTKRKLVSGRNAIVWKTVNV
jgi:hypothetical protein